MTHAITTDAALEEHIGKASPLIHQKAISWLDEGALGWIAASPLMIASIADGERIGVTLGGGPPGWASGDTHELLLPAAMIDDPGLVRAGASFGSSFLIPSIREVVRVNGRIASNDGDLIRVQVEECYLHCGKALIRSAFWKALPSDGAPDDMSTFSAASRFMALATANADGQADLSPKGDPAGQMAQCRSDAMWFADRPGNKRIDSFRNIVTRPGVAAILIIPGSTRVAHVVGEARIVDDPDVRACFTVDDKVPALATGIHHFTADLWESAALARAGLWPAPPAPANVKAARIALGHIKFAQSEEARMVAQAMSAPGVVEGALEADYEKNLY